MFKNIFHLIKTNKLIRYLVILIALFLLVMIGAFANLGEKENTQNNASNFIGKGYDEFSEKEKENGEEATQLAKEYYLKEYGEIRKSSYFYAELLSDNTYHVIGVDALDDRDVTFIEYDVNIETKSVKEAK